MKTTAPITPALRLKPLAMAVAVLLSLGMTATQASVTVIDTTGAIGYAGNGAGNAIGTPFKSQVFISGVSGEIDSLTMRLYTRAALSAMDLDVYIYNETQNTWAAVGTIGIPNISSNGYANYNVSLEYYQLTAGDQYRLALDLTPVQNITYTVGSTSYYKLGWAYSPLSVSVGEGDYLLSGYYSQGAGTAPANVEWSDYASGERIFSMTAEAVPEPCSYVLAVMGLAALAGYRRFARRCAA